MAGRNARNKKRRAARSRAPPRDTGGAAEGEDESTLRPVRDVSRGMERIRALKHHRDLWQVAQDAFQDKYYTRTLERDADLEDMPADVKASIEAVEALQGDGDKRDMEEYCEDIKFKDVCNNNTNNMCKY